MKENLQELLIRNLDHSRCTRPKDIDDVVVRAIDAVEAYSKEAPDLFILIDGRILADLMIDHSLGTTTTATYQIKRIDSDYFAEE